MMRAIFAAAGAFALGISVAGVTLLLRPAWFAPLVASPQAEVLSPTE
jgi:hypothetical protein